MAGTAVISTIKHDVTGAAPTFKDGAGNEIGQLTKSWCNYNGTSPTVRSSFNISSMTRHATGSYMPTFTVSLSDANYSYDISHGIPSALTWMFSGVNWKSSYGEISPTTSVYYYVHVRSDVQDYVNAGYSHTSVFR